MTNKKVSAGLIALIFKLAPKIAKVVPQLIKGGKAFQVGSAAVSMGAWSLLFSWQFAILIMLFLIVHESGHVWAMKKSGMKTKGIYFIPFFGGAAVADDMLPSRRAEVFVAIMGPIWGLVLSAAALGLWYMLGWPHFAAAAAWMAMINLFNLLPINPLDGGRILKSVMFSINSYLGLAFLAFGLVAAGFFIVRLHLWLFVILLIVGALEFGFEWASRKRKEKRNTGFEEYIHLPSMGKHGILASMGGYLVVAAVLYLIMLLGSQVPGAGDPITIFS